MNIRTKLAAVTLAAGSIIGGGAALTMTAAEAAPPVVKDPTATIVAKSPVTDLCKKFPDVCTKVTVVKPKDPPKAPDTTKPKSPDTTKPTETTKPKPNDTTKPTTKPHDTTKPEDPYYPEHTDTPVRVKPTFTG